MSSLSNINNNSSVINVGRTTPVTPGQQEAAKSIPVVLASDQSPVPVVEQNKIQSEVALSLLGIPRSEVALGIFADVNTYDVNPTEWSAEPATYTPGFGIKHLPDEAGALIQAPKNEFSILTSKRFFRYQPGRVSAATFGVKSTVSPADAEGEYDRNPAIRKYGIFDKFDGYYWETQKDGTGDRLAVVRRTQSLLKFVPVPFTGDPLTSPKQNQDYGQAGKAPGSTAEDPNAYPVATKLISDNRYNLVETAWDAALLDPTVTATLNSLNSVYRAKFLRDIDHTVDAYIWDLQWGGNGHTIANAAMFTNTLTSTGFVKAAFVLYTQLEAAIIAALNAAGETGAAARMPALSTITKSVFDTPPSYNTYNYISQSTINGANYGNRSKISTVFAIYARFLAYYGSKYTQSSGGTITAASYPDTPELSAAELEYRCYRDVVNVVEGYGKDLEFGGNARTVYNAKDYYRVLNGETYINYYLTNNATEANRHRLVKTLMTSSNPVTLGSATFDSVFTRFGLASQYSSKATTLCDLIINNFGTAYTGNADFTNSSQYGNLVILRDNLIMVHGAVHDPSLLKPKKQIVARATPPNIDYPNAIEVSEGDFVVGQYINCYDTGDATGLTNGKLYKVIQVRGTKGNILTLGDPANNDATVSVGIAAGTLGELLIEPNVPFIFPEDYYLPETETTVPRPDGSFPYLYSSDDILPHTTQKTAGFIDTARDLSVADNITALKAEIDAVNLRYNDWVKQNVDPKYYAVYEYRIPRSRFSTDQLNGQDNFVVYSDVSTDSSGRVYPGQPVQTDTGAPVVNSSVWDLDFTKVSMLKIEFSWYGAVGALFLAYVPVGNGEARWVRVHHLRASNQLKISSLGNATLPITYLVYGGGNPLRLGLEDNTTTGRYDTTSDHIVKYGASYYIDGGDRGTVRLYSYSTDNPVDVFGTKYDVGTKTLQSDSIGSYIDVNGVANLPSDLTFFMNAKLLTSSRADQNIEVIWVSGTKLYLNKSSLNSNTSLKLIANRPSVLFGLKAKQDILNRTGVGVRNRVQVYPTKLATANIGSTPVKMKVLKTPYFQPNVTTTNSFTLPSNYTITPNNIPLSPSNTAYLTNNGDHVYGWFRATIGQNPGTVFGKLYKDDGLYYFTLLETFSDDVVIQASIPFLKEGRFDIEGNTITGESESTITKERLSSVFVSTQIQVPVPRTGIEIASFFLKPGSDQFDLLSYFDYNKEYLSYPLTNQIDSLYLVSDSSQTNSNTADASISASLTWEEQ